MIPAMRFESQALLNGRTATGIPVPPAVVEALGGGRRIRVKVTIGDYSYRNSVVNWGGGFMLSFGAEHRAATGLRHWPDRNASSGGSTGPVRCWGSGEDGGKQLGRGRASHLGRGRRAG
jgi:hypothetical protein